MEDLATKYVQKVERALDIASDVVKNPDSMRTKLSDFLLNKLRGKSSREMRILFNELVDSDTVYLHMGGLSFGHILVPALYENNAKYAVGVDHYGGPMFATDVIGQLMQYILHHGMEIDEKLFIIRQYYFELEEEDKDIIKKHKVNLFYYSGEPRIDYHVKKFTEYYDYFDDTFIFITNGTNSVPTMEGTKLGIEKCNLKIVKEWNLEPESDMRMPGKLSWHSGLYIAVLQKNKYDTTKNI